ncbi:MAG: hypothetical protein IJQ67_03680 [Bacilli bacterium]|nr:hypothetical protein [Bacilli bacterium]
MDIAPLIVVIVSIVLMVLAIVFDWKIKIKKVSFALYWIFCLVGAIVCLIFKFAGENPIKDIFFNNANINPLKILVIFLSCTSISVLLDKIGFFSYIAAVILKKSKSSQKKLFFSFSLIIAVLTIFTSNDILILTFTPFICYFAKNAKIDPTPYILSEFVCANVWSMFFFIDNPTNIYMCTTFSITFIQYAIKMALPTTLCGILSTFLVYLLFRKKLSEKINIEDVEIVKPNKVLLIIGLSGLSVMVILMAISNYIGIELWYVPLICSVATYIASLIYIIIKKEGFRILGNSLKSLPYSLIPFLLSMSIFIVTLNNAGFIPQFASFLKDQHMFVTGYISFALGNLLNNIPMTMMFTTTLAEMLPETFTAADLKTVYAVVASSNVCALLTPIGSLAGIMFMKILRENEVKYNFKQFIGYGSIISIPTISLALLIIFLI